MGVECTVGVCENSNYRISSAEYDRRGKVIFIGITDLTKALSKNVDWQNYEFGLRYGVQGDKIIFDVPKIKNKQLNEFLSFAKIEQETRINKAKIPEGVKHEKLTFLKELYGNASGAGDVVANVAITVLFPFLPAIGQLAEFGAVGAQKAENAKAKHDISVLEYVLIMEHFLDVTLDL